MVLKKAVAIMILFIYLPAIAGVGFSTHYCSGEAGQTKVFSFSKESCCTEDPEDDDCCSDEIQIVKLDKDQLSEAGELILKPSTAVPFIVPVGYQRFFVKEIYQRTIAFTRDHVPLPQKSLPLIYCTLLI